MSILLITKVKNEADIIEYFIRYHLKIVDKMLIIDNGSLDGTYEIIQSLIAEGLPIYFVNEAYSDFDAYRLANQYTKEYVKKSKADYVVWMDADEFLVSKSNFSVRAKIESLDKNKVHFFNWKTYLYKQDPVDNLFDPADYSEYRNESEEQFTKIIIPANVLNKYEINVTAGNHSYVSEEIIEEQLHPDICFAHFPIRSIQQYKKQIVLNSIAILANPNVKRHTGFHWRKMYMESTPDELVDISQHYALYAGSSRNYEKVQFPIIDRKYAELINNSLEEIMIKTMEIQALKLKKAKTDKKIVDKKLVAVWGTGAYADRMIERIVEKYNIEVFVDSDRQKEFKMFHDKIIVSPNKMRFFNFTEIILATEKYNAEIVMQIKETLPCFDLSNVYNFEDVCEE